MKKANFIISIVLIPIDFALVLLAAISAYYFRFSGAIAQVRPVFFELPFSDYLPIILQVAFLSIVVFAAYGFYTMENKKLLKEFNRIISGVSMVAIFLIMAFFLQREIFSSRFIIILAWALTIIYLFLARVIVILIRNLFFKKGHGLSNLIIVGSSDSRQALVMSYQNNPALGFRVLGEYDNLASLSNDLTVSEYLPKKNIEALIQTDSSVNKDEALDLLVWCQERHINFNYVASLFQTQSLNFELNSVAGLPLVSIKGTPLDGWRRIYKRLFDFLLAIILLLILSPLLILLSLLVKLTSSGPVIVSLDRVGAKGRTFKFYKFRSMVKDAHLLKEKVLPFNERPDGPLFKMKNDPRITNFGQYLRRTSLDELPQLINVIKGEMSLVGPRPHEPQEVSQYQRGYKKLLAIKPGITGLAQVSGRSNLLFSEEAKLDVFYIENWSVWLDLVILLKTPRAIFKKDEAC